jgi:hypothetical protein
MTETIDEEGDAASKLLLAAGEVEARLSSQPNPPFPDTQLSCDLFTEASKPKITINSTKKNPNKTQLLNLQTLLPDRAFLGTGPVR